MESECYREEGRHLPLSRLKQLQMGGYMDNGYILNYVPPYPRPELHVSHVSHSTDLQGLWGIKNNGGFRNPNNQQEAKMVWFSLTVSPDELRDWAPLERGTLQNFATSPAFSSRSRYGSFRFTFSLEDVLYKYRQQFCGGQPPVLRVYQTVVYKQEVMYVVLVHSPSKWRQFRDYPLLGDRPYYTCVFRAGPKPHFVWRPQAMSGTHRFRLQEDKYGNLSARPLKSPRYYVWDHVSLALHVDDKVLRFEDNKLRESLRFCEKDDVTVPKDGRYFSYQSFEEADYKVSELWPYYPYYCLEEFNQSFFHINN